MEEKTEQPVPRFEVNFLESHDHASLVAELQRLATLLGKPTVTAKEIDKYGRLSSRTVMQKFGTLRKAHEAAGLIAARYTLATDEELMTILAELWTITLRESGRPPLTSEVKKYGFPVSARTIVKHFGSWKKALIKTANTMPGVPTPPAPAPETEKKKCRDVMPGKRFDTFKRDLYTCMICRRSGVALELDHIIPVNRGGSNQMDNLQTLCRDCNRGKSDNLQ